MWFSTKVRPPDLGKFHYNYGDSILKVDVAVLKHRLAGNPSAKCGARALATESSVLLLDESTRSMYLSNQADVLRSIIHVVPERQLVSIRKRLDPPDSLLHYQI